MDRKVFAATNALKLPPHTSDIEIRYTALNFVAPQKIKFRYWLEGRDQAWQDADTRRQAFYTDLPPGTYRFRVQASNSEGAWPDADTATTFSVAPTFLQTPGFLLLCAAGAALAIWALMRIRVRQIADHLRVRFDDRMAERERIARELHDTLLQSTQGLIYKVQAATHQVAADDPARGMLERALEHADEVVAEGRDRIQDLRVAEDAGTDLRRSFEAIGAELAKGDAVDFSVVVEGDERDLLPNVRDEAYLIGREALINAFRHADANAIEVFIVYADEAFCARVRDDSSGIDAGVAGAAPRRGHWGLKGTRERAKKLGASFVIRNGPHGGTDVELRIPAALAYAVRAARPSWLQRWRG